MKPKRKFITAAEVNYTPGAYIYGDGVEDERGYKMEQESKSRLIWIHKELISAYEKACSIDENNFKVAGKIDLALMKKKILDLIDDVTEIKRRRGII